MDWFIPAASALGGALGLGYAVLCSWLIKSWRALPVWEIPPGYRPGVSISVVISARNEASCIRHCVESVLDQDYPPELLEVIVIDDHSEDGTAAVVRAIKAPNLRLIRLAEHLGPGTIQSFKKKAIQTGVMHARGELIVTTDADCIAPPQWLRIVASLYETRRPVCILAPVGHWKEANFLERFQSLDLAGLMLCAGALAHRGMPLLANGANLAYTKFAFEAVNGFEGIDRHASGDDMMLVHKLAARFSGRVLFLKNAAAAVLTPAKSNWRDFRQQRIRWATKTRHYRRPAMTAALAAVFLLCLLILTMLLGAPALGFLAAAGGLALLGLKGAADLLLLREACRFFQREDLLRRFFLSEAMHTVYMVAAGVWGNFARHYEWKGRRVR